MKFYSSHLPRKTSKHKISIVALNTGSKTLYDIHKGIKEDQHKTESAKLVYSPYTAQYQNVNFEKLYGGYSQ